MIGPVVRMRLEAETEAARRELREAASEVTRLGTAAQTSAGKAQTLSEQIDRRLGVGTGVQRTQEDFDALGRSLDDLRSRFNPVFAVVQRYKATLSEIRSAHRVGALSTDEMRAAITRERQAALASIAAIKGRGAAYVQANLQAAQSSRLAAGSIANLGAQVNDIGVMLAAGQSPLQLALQQGTQITQVLGPLGAAGSVQALKAALLSTVSPISLITIGSIAAGAAMTQWLFSAGEEARSLEDAMSDLEDRFSSYEAAVKAASVSTEELELKFGDAAEDVRELLDRMREIQRDKLDLQLKATLAVDLDADALEVAGVRLREKARAIELFDLQASSGRNAGRNGSDVAVHERDAMIAEVQADYDRLAEAAAGSVDEQIAALTRLIDSFSRAAKASGDVTEEENARLETYSQLLLKLQEMKALEEALRRKDEATAGDMVSELEHELALRAAIRAHGEDSAEAGNLRLARAREMFQAEVEALRITEQRKALLLDLWDEKNPQRDPDAEIAQAAIAAINQTRDAAAGRRVEAERTISALEREVAIQEAIARYGEDSVAVARLRAEAEREVYDELLASDEVTEAQKERLSEALDTMERMAATDIAGGLSEAAAEAARVADEIIRALDAAQQLSSRGSVALEESRIRVEYADDPVGEAGALARARMQRAQGVRRDGAEGGELAALDAEVEAYGRLNEQIERNNQARIAALRSSRTGGGGGRGDRDSFKALQKAAEDALLGLDDAVAGIHEKVAAGLLTTAEGVDGIAGAKERAANQIAGLIPQLERAAEAAGPDAAAAVEEWRRALGELSGDLNRTSAQIGETVSQSFSGALADVATGASEGIDAVNDLGETVLNMIARITAERFTNRFVSPLIDAFVSILPFAKGGVPGADLSAHSNTVGDEPIAFAMPGGGLGVAREAGTEAILPVVSGPGGEGVRALGPDGREGVLPLKRSGSGDLGVQLPAGLIAAMQGPAAGAAPEPRLPEIVTRPTFFARGGIPGRSFENGTTAPGAGSASAPAVAGPGAFQPVAAPLAVNIYNNNAGGSDVSVAERAEGDARFLDIVIEKVEAGIAANARRGVGPFSDVLGGTFGINRVVR